jgi:hypothetical protein
MPVCASRSCSPAGADVGDAIARETELLDELIRGLGGVRFVGDPGVDPL